jgi:DNA polymerase I-like protein with 3'-5' exonuclease and polymerase domains
MIFLDIETNLKHDTIWLCVTKHSVTGEVRHWREADSLQQYLEGEQVVGHNIIGFDAPVLKKVWGVGIPANMLVDTLVMSRLYKPDIEIVAIMSGKAPKPHSLEAWGHRLGSYKIGFTDFDGGWTQEMATYCEQDVQLLEKLYGFLTNTMTREGFSLQSIQLEHEVALICRGMEENGFMLDMPKAMALHAILSGRMSEIEESMQQVFPPIVEQRISEKTGKQLKDKITIFNVGSRQQIADRLITLGWKPKKMTPTGQPIVDETTLKDVVFPEGQIIAEYLMIQKRVTQISSWLELVADDGRVHGRVTTNGAVTGRATHSSPNMAQIPAVGGPYGAECREVWTVPKGYKQVGVDLSGIELRCLGHYLNDQAWMDELLKGDIHWFNAQSFGLVDKGTVKDDNNPEHKKARNITKTLTYGVLYGAGAAKAGSIVGGNSSKGKKLIDSFINNTPGLSALKKKISRLMAKGHLPALDGRRVWVRSEHAALNTLLQSAGAIVAKQWLVESTKLLQEKGINAKLLAFVHDETQWEVREDQAEEAARLIEQAATKAGEALGFRCPVDAEGKVGNNWRECH